MDRVTRNLIFNIPQHATPKEAVSGDGTYYPVQISSRQGEEDLYWNNKVSEQINEEAGNEMSSTSAYIAIKVSSGSPDHILSNSETVSFLREGKATPSTAEGTDLFVEKLDDWMPSPDRETKLELVRQDHLYGIWTYREEKNPSKLFSNQDHEMESALVKIDASPEKMRALEEERKDIIKRQIVKKRSTMAERWHSMEDLYSASTSSPSRENITPQKTKSNYSAEFALCFDNLSSQRADTPLSSENIDTEQINFAAAREQFLKLEMENQNAQFSPKPQFRNPTTVTLPRNSYERNWHKPYKQTDFAQDGPNIYYHRVADTNNELPKVASQKDEMCGLQNSTSRTGSLKGHSLVTTSREDLDSGLGELPLEYSTGYASDGSTSHELFGSTQELGSTGEQLFLSETPIEKEIRLALEREEDLRRERGILKSSSMEELMEIRKKPLLSLTSPSSSSWKAKDKWRGDIFLQREIEKETRREDDLKYEGKVIGMYEKGMIQEIGERKKFFEQQDDVPVFPRKASQPNKTVLEKHDWQGSVNLKEHVKQNLNIVERQDLDERLEPYQSFSTKAMAEPSSYGTSFMASRQASEHFLESQPLNTRVKEDSGREDGRTSDLSSEEKVFLRKDHFCLRPWMPRFSVTPKQERPRVSLPKNEQENIALEDYSRLGTKRSLRDEQEKPSDFVKKKEQGPFIVYKEYFKLKPWKPRLKVKQVESQYTPQKGNQQENIFLQEENFRLKPLKSHRSLLIEREIQEALQREQELQEHRRGRHILLPDAVSAQKEFDSSSDDCPQSWHSSQSSVCRH